jgi:periplasmic protein TonB
MAVHINGGTMDYRNMQAAPSKHLTGIAVVVGLHLFMAWLVVSGVGGTIVITVFPPPIAMTPIAPEKEKLPEPTVIEDQAPPILTVPVVPLTDFDDPRPIVAPLRNWFAQYG